MYLDFILDIAKVGDIINITTKEQTIEGEIMKISSSLISGNSNSSNLKSLAPCNRTAFAFISKVSSLFKLLFQKLYLHNIPLFSVVNCYFKNYLLAKQQQKEYSIIR